MEKIKIEELSDFSVKQILDCGQIFRYFLLDDKNAVIISKDKFAVVKEYGANATVYTDDKNYFYNYFDLNNDYGVIKNELKKDEFLAPCCKACYGIRILKQDFFEMLVSFIISANNNIPRIKKSVNYLSERFGKKYCVKCGELDDFLCDICEVKNGVVTYYAFPTLQELKRATIEDFVDAGLGYRAVQLYDTIQKITENDLIAFKKKSNKDKFEWLLSLKGVGEKVANCVMLFAEGDTTSFPVDTWINKVYNDITRTKNTNRKEIEKILKNKYGKYSGYAQQYFFYYYRNFVKK